MELLEFPSMDMIAEFREKRAMKHHKSYLSRKITKNDPNCINDSGSLIINKNPLKLFEPTTILPKPNELLLNNNPINDINSISNIINNDSDINIEYDYDVWKDHFQLACLCAFSYFPLSKSGKKLDDYNKAKKHFDYALMLLTNLYDNQKNDLLVPLCIIDQNNNDTCNNSVNSTDNIVRKKAKNKNKKRNKLKKPNDIQRESFIYKEKFKQLSLNNKTQYNDVKPKKKNKNVLKKNARKMKMKKLKRQRSSSLDSFAAFVALDKKRKLKIKPINTALKPLKRNSVVAPNAPRSPKEFNFSTFKGFANQLKQSITEVFSEDDQKVTISKPIKQFNGHEILNEGFVKLGYGYGCFLYDIQDYNECLKSLLLCCEWYTKEFADPTSIEALLLPPSTLFDNNNGIRKVNFRKLATLIAKVINKIQVGYDKLWIELNMKTLITQYIENNELNMAYLKDKPLQLVLDLKLFAQCRYEFGKKCLEHFRISDAKTQYRECIKILNNINVNTDLKLRIQNELKNIESKVNQSRRANRQKVMKMHNKRRNT